MIVKENKKPAAATLAGCVILALVGGYCYHAGFGGAALFASATAAVCAFFCALRLKAKNYLQIDDDALTIVRGADSQRFAYDQIENLGIKTFSAGKNRAGLLNFTFKKAPQLGDRFNFLRFYSDTEATLPGTFEISIYELSKILRRKAGFASAPQDDDTQECAAAKTRKGAKGSKKTSDGSKGAAAKNSTAEDLKISNSDPKDRDAEN